jgi:FkbM family methyltransferase
MCGRLFRRDILSDDVFDLPLGQLHEDVTTFVRILFKSNVVAHTKRAIYYYTFNPKSITNNFSEEHANGMFRGFDDWVANARRVGLLSELSQCMTGGIEKLVNICVERCALSDILGIDEKITILQDIDRKYSALPVPRIAPSLRGTKFLARFEGQNFEEHNGPIEDAIEENFPKPRQNGDGPTLPKGMQPSAMASRLKDKIVLIGQVDYQIRNAAVLARELRLRGYSCVILDNSAFASGGRRQLRPEESDIFGQAEHVKVEKSPYEADWLSTARLVVTFNDFNDDFREALEYRNRLGLPSVGMVEGINDFLRVDFAPYRHLPYRRCDYVFLAGEDDRRYFEDRQTHVVGLPIIEVLGSKQPSFPVKPTAVLNVNFTYGALEHERDGFLECATKAFAAAGVDYVITQHPMDKGNLEGLPVSDRTQYQLIDEGTVFVSRFATGILEALASGKPAVYFNPHAEKVEKFKAPMGAFEIATTEGELVNALRRVLDDVEKGVDFRKRALPLLKRHTAYRSEGSSVSERFGDAVSSVLQENDRQRSISDLFFDALNTRKPFRENSSELIFGSLDRRHKARLNEEELISRFFGTREGIMIDVGTKAGGGPDIYLGKGWTIHTFEPFPDVGRRLPEARPSSSPLVVNEQAVSKEVGLNRTLPTGDVNTSTGKLPAIGEDNRQGSEVTATTLREYYEEHRLQHIEFLRIDARKNGKSVLEGIPWDRDRPDVILTTFDGQEMVPPGNALRDIAKLLVDRGYHVYVSEWLPSQQSVIGRDWSRLVRYSAGFDIGNTWGNVIGFVQAPDETELRLLVQEAVKFAAQPLEEKEVREKPYRAPERAFYAGFGEWLEPRSPRLFRLLQRLRRTTGQGMPTTRTELAAALRARSPALFRLGQIVSWTARAVRRHKLLTVLVAAACIALLVFPAFAQEVWGRASVFGGRPCF